MYRAQHQGRFLCSFASSVQIHCLTADTPGFYFPVEVCPFSTTCQFDTECGLGLIFEDNQGQPLFIDTMYSVREVLNLSMHVQHLSYRQSTSSKLMT